MTVQQLEAATEEELVGRPSWVAPTIIGFGLMMVTLESTIMANALPTIADALKEEPLRLTLAMTMFLMATAVFLPISAWLADRFGARRILMFAMALFALSSAACGWAHNLLELVLGRMVQGASASMLIPVGRLVLLRITPRERMVDALTLLTVPLMVGPLIGPLLGGAIVTFFNWRWIFFINLPVAAAAIVLVRMFVPEVKEDTTYPMDWPGFALTAVGLASVIFGFENLGRSELPPATVVGLFVLSAACFVLLARHARGNPNAIIDLEIFQIPTYAACIIGGAFLRVAVGATPFLLAMLLQVGFGMNALAAGALTLLSGAGALFMKGVTPPLVRRFGFRRTILVNGVLVALSLIVFVFVTPSTPIWALSLIVGLGGFVRTLQFTAMNSLAYADLPRRSQSRGSTTSSMAQQVTQSLGIGASALLLHWLQGARHAPRLTWEAIVPAFPIFGVISLVALVWFIRLPPEIGEDLRGVRAP